MKTQSNMSAKGRRRQKKISLEDIYCNKKFVPPKEQNLETIFEEPRKAKDGAPILTSVRKYKRYLHFDDTQNKIQKRKRNAKKCAKKLKSGCRITRSSSEVSECDVSLYILDAIGDSSSDSDSEISLCTNKTCFDTPISKAGRHRAAEIAETGLSFIEPHTDVFGAPKRKRFRPNNTYEHFMVHGEVDSSKAEITSFSNATDNDCVNDITDDFVNDTAGKISASDTTDNPSVNCTRGTNNAQELTVKKEENVESPRKSCIIS